jgi:hypothetical protein
MLAIACVIALVASLLLAVAYPVCRDWAYLDTNTGSRRGYREWIFGIRTGHWERPSKVDVFMQGRFPRELEHRWISYAGTGRNIFGMKVLHGHGRPGQLLRIDQQTLNQWFETLPEEEKRQFYALLVSNDQEAIEKKIDLIYEALANAPSQ